jgi:hypothetical protein
VIPGFCSVEKLTFYGDTFGVLVLIDPLTLSKPGKNNEFRSSFNSKLNLLQVGKYGPAKLELIR